MCCQGPANLGRMRRRKLVGRLHHFLHPPNCSLFSLVFCSSGLRLHTAGFFLRWLEATVDWLRMLATGRVRAQAAPRLPRQHCLGEVFFAATQREVKLNLPPRGRGCGEAFAKSKIRDTGDLIIYVGVGPKRFENVT